MTIVLGRSTSCANALPSVSSKSSMCPLPIYTPPTHARTSSLSASSRERRRHRTSLPARHYPSPPWSRSEDVLGVGLISPASVSAALKVSNTLASTSLSLSPICGCGGGGGGGADVDVDPPPLVFVFPDADPRIDMGSTIGLVEGRLSSSGH